MKKHLIYTAITLALVAFSFSACKKDSKNDINNESLFKNTNWTGEFNYAGKGPEPVSIEFLEGGQLVWNELLADHTGSWKVTGNQVAIGLDGSPSFNGNISGNSLTNIQSSDMSGRSLKSAALNTDPIPELDGTVWGAANVSLKFKPGAMVDLIFGPPSNLPTYTDLPYLRTGKAIHFAASPGYNWFTVITNASTMQGTNHAPSDPTVYSFKVTKQ
ncbi:hypothetical protein SAMN05518672_101840 [Chitinophaga sp. CF118]|uniref:hypothetical protein n=1 Tax=Chitinophaga sp. CF118 TaxID=1884367 RepID=UPI0008E990BB|nr:hypothetical protein [Chitinophaga sp. CF118]SFD16686.1 hypothetical protein SAMN05518672_101840 [Chitinophaga sp. CF118]